MSKIYFFLCVLFALTVNVHAQTIVINYGTAGTPQYNAGPVYRSSASSAYDASRYAYLYTASELATAGINTGSIITQLGWVKNNTATSTGGGIFRIYLKNSAATDFSAATMPWATLNTGALLVYENLSQSIPATITPNYITFDLSSPFTYTGGALEVSVEWDINQVSGSPSTGTFDWLWSTVPDRIYGTGQTGLANAATLSSTTNSISDITDRRPFIQITYTAGGPCTNPPTPGTATSSVSSMICPGSSVNLNLTGNSTGTGLTYQWESSPTNSPFVPTAVAPPASVAAISVTPASSTWYRAKLVCNSGTPAYTTPLQVQVASGFPGGTYTINNGSPTGGSNFNTFADAIAAISCGITGPVVFNVTPGTPYAEFVTIGDIYNTNNVNTIKFNGNGATVQYTNTATQVPILTLNGTKYVKFDSLTFKTLSTTYAYGALITNGALLDSITRCTFDLTALTTTTAANASGIVFSGSSTSPTTAGSNGSRCYIGRNTIASTTGTGGAYYGIAISGASDSNTLFRNTLTNYYMYGIYISGASGTKIRNNEMSRATKTAVTTFYGIYTTGVTEGTIISNNRIHDPAAPSVASTSSFYGIYNLGDAVANNRTVISNNAIYNINQGGIIYGIYNSAAPYTNIYHNTVVIDKALTGTSANYGIANLGDNTTTNIYNNLVSITQGTLGIKYGFYHSAANSVDDAQRNNIYVNSAQTGVQNYGYYTVAYLTQAAFQAAYPALEQGSLTVNPQFTNVATGNLLPTNPMLMGNGINLLSQVSTDILGVQRSSLPTPGAFEIPPTPGPNAGILSLITPVAPFCQGPQPVQISVVNSGSVQLNNFQVFWTMNNIAQPTYSFNGLLDTFNGAGQYIDTVTLGTISIPSGSNAIKAWVVVAGDVNHLNDTLNATVTPTNFTVSSFADTLCVGGDATINLSPDAGYATGMIQWQSSADGLNFNPITGANTPVYTATNMTATRYFRVFINSGTQGCVSNSKKVNIVSPTILSVIDSFHCGPGTVTIGANPAPGSGIKWFDVPVGGDPIATGNYYTTPSLSNTTTYYAQAATGGGLGTVGPLTPTAVGTNGGTAAAIATYFMTFDVVAPTTLVSVDVFPTATVGSSGGIVIQNSASAVIATIPFTTTVTGGTTAQTILINLALPPGTGYKMGQLAPPINLIRNSAGAVYPYNSPAINIISNNFGPAYYYYFYNWQFASGCEGPRVPVVASINAFPDADLGPDVTSCTNGSTTVTLNSGVAGAQYLWSNNATTPTTTVNASGNYNVKVTKNGCVDRDTIAVTFNPNPVVNIGVDSTICDGQTVMLNAGNQGSAYIWDNGASTNMIYGAATAGMHYVKVTDANNCNGSDTMNLTIIPAPVVDLGNDSTVCAGVVLTLDAGNPGLLFLWNDGSNMQTLEATDSGTYFVKVTSPGCFRVDSINIDYFITPDADGINAVYMDAATYTFMPINPQNAIDYIWDFGDGSPHEQGNMVQHTYSTNGIYSVKLSLVGHCDSVEEAIVKTVDVFDAAKGGTGINNLSNDNIFTVYPNPSNGVITIENKSGNTIELVEVYAVTGQKLITNRSGNTKVTINAGNLSSGIYMLKAVTKNGNSFLKKIEIRK